MRVRDLGPLRVEVEGREVAVSGAKLTAIVSMLAMQANQRVSTDLLVDAVWGPDAGPDRLPTLESHIWRLRRILEPGRTRGAPAQVLVNDAPGYRLVVLADEIDSARFDRIAEDTRGLAAVGDVGGVIRAADTALGLWRGRPHDPVADHPAAAPVIARLIETRRQVAARRIDALLETGDAGRALRDVELLLGESAFDEHLWAARMLALHRLGRTSDALQAFRDARTTLRDQVGIDPGAELTVLQHRILDGDPDLVPRLSAVPATASSAAAGRTAPNAATTQLRLPMPLTPLLGRESVVAQLTSLLRLHPLLTITGAAGCGKTRLAIEVAARTGGGYRDGAWFIDLAAVDEPALVTDVVLSTVGIAPGTTGTAMDGLRAYCRDRALLLVLDNCEHVLAAATLVAQTVVGASDRCAVLVTSREPLDVPGEVLWTLVPLALPDPRPGEHAEPTAAPAVALFLDRMRAADSVHVPTGAELDLIVEICIALDGVPLAIELAAARVRSATLREIADEVARDPSGLRRLGRHDGQHDRWTVRGSIDAGHRLLTAPEQAMHRRLAVLPGPFSRDAATAVSAGPPVDPDEVTYLLGSLVHRSLLTSAPASRPGGATQFRQLATVRGHAAHALRAAGEEAGTQHRRDDWVAQFIDRRPRIAHADDNNWYPEAVEALPTIRATLHRALVDEPSSAGSRLVSRLGMLWYFRGRMGEGRRWTELGQQVLAGDSTGGRDPVPIVMQLAIASGDAVRGRSDLAVPRVERALAHLETLDLAQLDAEGLVEVGDHYAPLAIALGRTCPPPLIAALAASAADLADATGDAGLAILGQVLAVSAGVTSSDPSITLERSGALFQQANEVGHLFAALVASGIQIAFALAARDPRGRIWARRNYDMHRSQGGTQNGLLLESSANFAAFDADPSTAVRMFAASQATARRAGTTWPRHPITRTTLAELQRDVPQEAFARAWRAGLTLGVLTARPVSG